MPRLNTWIFVGIFKIYKMKKAIAMRCTLGQFEEIKPKLGNYEIDGSCLEFQPDLIFFKSYLTNNFCGKKLISFTRSKESNREYLEEWNEKVFLEACGIENEKTYQITQEQLEQLETGSTTEKLSKWFPEVFKRKLEVGKWYVSKELGGSVFCITNTNTNDNNCFSGFGFENRVFYNDRTNYWNCDDIFEATNEEVFEALKNEAVKRGFVEGSMYKSAWNGNDCKYPKEIFYIEKYNCLSTYGGNECIFKNGIWATIIPTKTRQQAEKELNCRIIG